MVLQADLIASCSSLLRFLCIRDKVLAGDYTLFVALASVFTDPSLMWLRAEPG